MMPGSYLLPEIVELLALLDFVNQGKITAVKIYWAE